MYCPWYLGLEATKECIRTCPITEENRDNSVCPEAEAEAIDKEEDDAFLCSDHN